MKIFYIYCPKVSNYEKAYPWIFILLATTFCARNGSPKSDWFIDGSSFKSEVEEKNGTWEKTPSMGWMHIPLVEYQGGGAEATFEPLKEHLSHYGQRLADLFSAGLQAAYRGSMLNDAPETLDHTVKQNLTINVYYTGLSRVASISENDSKARRFSINRNYEITIPVSVESNSQS